MRVAVIVPCHIHYLGQLDKLSACIRSLQQQTYKCTILVGISFSNVEFYTQFKKYVFPLFEKQVRFILAKEQTYQMIHIYNCFKCIYQPEYIMFCDDDDIYLPTRVETFVGLASMSNIVREVIPDHNEVSEYWCYGVKSDVIHEFYERCMDNINLLHHKFGDIYLRNFLLYTQQFGTITTFTARSPLYIYDNTNTNSITGNIKQLRELTMTTGRIECTELVNQYLLSLINNDVVTNRLISEYVSTHDISLAAFVDEKLINEFCTHLYR